MTLLAFVGDPQPHEAGGVVLWLAAVHVGQHEVVRPLVHVGGERSHDGSLQLPTEGVCFTELEGVRENLELTPAAPKHMGINIRAIATES